MLIFHFGSPVYLIFSFLACIYFLQGKWQTLVDPIAVGTLIILICVLVYLSSAQRLGHVAVRYSEDIGCFSTSLQSLVLKLAEQKYFLMGREMAESAGTL